MKKAKIKELIERVLDERTFIISEYPVRFCPNESPPLINPDSIKNKDLVSKPKNGSIPKVSIEDFEDFEGFEPGGKVTYPPPPPSELKIVGDRIINEIKKEIETIKNSRTKTELEKLTKDIANAKTFEYTSADKDGVKTHSVKWS